MRRKEFIDTILNGISDTFDIYHNYWFNNRKFVIYAYNYKNRDKFSTTDSAKLWDMKCFEHLFFINSDSLDEEQLKDLVKFTIEQIEPHFVRNDNKLPCKNHMYSYISFIIITRNKPDDNVKLMIEKTNICLEQEGTVISAWSVLPQASSALFPTDMAKKYPIILRR